MNEIKDHPGVIAKPPIIYGVALVVGLVLQGVSPLPIASSHLRSWAGVASTNAVITVQAVAVTVGIQQSGAVPHPLVSAVSDSVWGGTPPPRSFALSLWPSKNGSSGFGRNLQGGYGIESAPFYGGTSPTTV